MNTKKVKKYVLKDDVAVNHTQKIAMEELANWLLNDPDPNATLDKIKKEEKRKKALSKNNPLKLLKEELTEQEWKDFWMDLTDLRSYYAIEFYKKNKKIKGKHLPQMYYLPQVIYAHNSKYWSRLLKEYRFYDHPEFMVVPPEKIEGYKEIKYGK
jgi:hypothetical protein